VVSAGLWRRREGAYWTALTLLLLGAGLSLLKGLEFEVATVLGLTAAALAPCRRAFNRRSRLIVGLSRNLSIAWLAADRRRRGRRRLAGLLRLPRRGLQRRAVVDLPADADASRFLRAEARSPSSPCCWPRACCWPRR
jgi:phosphatidylglycerol lysyltransferase